MTKQIQWFVSIFVSAAIFMLVGTFTGVSNSKAATANLSDGTYTVPALVRKTGEDLPSDAQNFFDQTARVEVANGQYTIHLTLIKKGETYITGMKMDKVPVTITGTSVTVTLPNPDSQIVVDFNLDLSQFGMGKVNESARFVFDWAHAKKDGAAVTTPATPNTTTSPTVDSSSSSLPSVSSQSTATSSSVVASSSSSSAASSSTTDVPGIIQTAPVTGTTSTAGTVTKKVAVGQPLNTKSHVTKYLAKTAEVKKQGKHYVVTMRASYKKSLNFSRKAIRPVSVNGTKLKSAVVKYGQTKTTYTMAYTYTVSSLQALKKPVLAKLQVVVPRMHVNHVVALHLTA